MTPRITRWIAAFAMIAALAAVTGCAKKATQAPPQPTTTPTPAPTTPPPAPETPPTPAPTPAPKGFTAEDLRPAFFDFDSYALTEAARTVLDANAKLLRDNASARVVIEGHCDERGTAEYNLALSERRAAAAQAYVVSLGVPASRVKIVSYGKEFPFDPGHDEAAWAKNRRAHFVITGK